MTNQSTKSETAVGALATKGPRDRSSRRCNGQKSVPDNMISGGISHEYEITDSTNKSGSLGISKASSTAISTTLDNISNEGESVLAQETNSSLLLRLFTSQFFGPSMAVSYLFKYPGIVGVQHYLCNELRKFPMEEVEFFLPQLVHLMITRPNESVAIESLLIDMSLHSSHVSIILYWYLQAYLSDLSPNPRTASFKHCQRVFNKVQELLFIDIAPELLIDAPEPAQHAYTHAFESVVSCVPVETDACTQKGTYKQPWLSSVVYRLREMFRLGPQVRENVAAALVGIGSSASSAGAPSLAPTMGWLAIAQGQGVKIHEALGGDDIDLPPQHRLLGDRSRPTSRKSSNYYIDQAYKSNTFHAKTGLSSARYIEDKDGYDSENSYNTNKGAAKRRIDILKNSVFSTDPTINPFTSESALQYELAHKYQSTHLSLENNGLFRSNSTSNANARSGSISPGSEDSGESAGINPRTMRSKSAKAPESSHSTGPHMKRRTGGSRSLTPVRTSTDSCHTVAVMETLEHTKLIEDREDILSRTDEPKDILPRKKYLDKASKEFQRNAKQLGRRIDRSSNTTKTICVEYPETLEQRSEYMDRMRKTMAVCVEEKRKVLERRTSYFGAEIKFMTALMDISQRVCAVAKSGRQQFLKAELTMLNHSLDKNICIPLWCPDTNGMKHHRIVRIPTEDTVVLNSAERAPYLLTLEVLEPDVSEKTPGTFSNQQVESANHHSTPKEASASDTETKGESEIHTKFVTNSIGSLSKDESKDQNKDPGPINKACDFDSKVASATEGISNRQDIKEESNANGGILEAEAGFVSNASAELSKDVTAVDVDEDLMVEVFGDLDVDLSDPADDFRRRSRPALHPYNNRASNEKRRQKRYGRGSSERHPASRSNKQRTQPTLKTTTSGAGSSSIDNQQHSSPKPLQRVPQVPTIRTSYNNHETQQNLQVLQNRCPVTQEEIRERMRTASVLLAQLARQQKALGIKVKNLVVPQQPISGADQVKASQDTSDSSKRRGRLGNATSQAIVMEEIREKLVNEMMQLEELRRTMQPDLSNAHDPSLSDHNNGSSFEAVNGDIDLHAVEYKDDPSAKVLKEDWESKKARIRSASPYGRHKNWNLLSVIVKEGADLRQEQFALQLIREMQRIWKREGVPVFVQYYRIMVTGEDCGLMETITNTVSVHSIKKEFYSRNTDYAGLPYTLYNYFVTTYGTPDTDAFKKAQDNFMRSLVAYSLITYILQIRDRHNGNILLDTAGHIIHIDFGFMLSNSPGSVGFELAPFKLPMEYVDILGGQESSKFKEFRELLATAFLALRKNSDNIILLVELMLKDSPLPCLSGGPSTVASLRDRFHLTLSEPQIDDLLNNMILSSCDNVTMRMYDAFQYYSNGIL